MKPDLIELAESCEQASGPDPYLDEAIMDALFEPRPFVQLANAPEGTGFKAWRVDGHTQSRFRYTASLDAAVTLVPEGMAFVVGFNVSGEHFASVDFDHQRIAATPVLALCAAALRARGNNG
jgi:hypothetical protein